MCHRMYQFSVIQALNTKSHNLAKYYAMFQARKTVIWLVARVVCYNTTINHQTFWLPCLNMGQLDADRLQKKWMIPHVLAKW